VLADNQLVGHTDANGNALIPRLRAYDRNIVSVDQRDLPMDAEIGALTVTATPYFRSGVAVKFPIQRVRAATFTVVLEDGGALPTGAVLTMVEPSGSALLGANGDVYAGDLQARNVLRAQWHGQQCDFVVPYAAGDDPLPDLGTFVCKGVQR
jgi:outer membrane usher protein